MIRVGCFTGNVYTSDEALKNECTIPLDHYPFQKEILEIQKKCSACQSEANCLKRQGDKKL